MRGARDVVDVGMATGLSRSSGALDDLVVIGRVDEREVHVDQRDVARDRAMSSSRGLNALSMTLRRGPMLPLAAT
jgi:hypothetical protein